MKVEFGIQRVDRSYRIVAKVFETKAHYTNYCKAVVNGGEKIVHELPTTDWWLSKSTLRMIKKYGKELCLKALYSNEIVGNGTTGMCIDLKVHHNTANALCNAGREITEHDPEMWNKVFRSNLYS